MFGLFRGIAVLRDPVHLVVSHYWYDYDGHEGGRKYLNTTQGLIFQLTRKRAYVALARANQLVRRNDPETMKIACLEDFMVNEASFYLHWTKAFAFLGMPINATSTIFADLNPLSSNVSTVTTMHTTFHDREELSLNYAYEVLELEKFLLAAHDGGGIDSAQHDTSNGVLYGASGNLASLSEKLRCWDWRQNNRGEKDAWIL